MQPTNYSREFPQLFRAPLSAQLPLETLASIGVKSSDAARAKGYVCVRAHSSTGHSATAGLWVSASDLPLLNAACVALKERENTSRQLLLERAATKEARDLTAHRAKSVTTLMALTGLKRGYLKAVIPLELQDALSRASLDGKSVADAVLKHYNVLWHEQTPGGSPLHYRRDQLAVAPEGRAAVCALLDGDTSAYLAALDVAYSALCERVSELADRWEATRPAWFPGEQLRAWARRVSQAQGPQHPLDGFPNLLPQNGAVKIRYRERKLSVEFKARFLKERLWNIPDLGENALPHHAQELWQATAVATVEECLQEFLAEHEQADERAMAPESMRSSHEQWTNLLVYCYVGALNGQFNKQKAYQEGKDRLKRQIAVANLRVQTAQCRQEVPNRLMDFYPIARKMGRRITFLMGPTNSGKTYQALELLKAAPTGVYLGPLRLLALEVQETLLSQGLPISLATGELIVDVPGARHQSATIEMLDLNNPVDVAVVDEVQMLEDADRGASWLQAVLGAPAKHLVLVGSANALAAVQRLANYTGEPLEVIGLKRLSPLTVLKAPSNLGNLEPGSALIVFSRRDVLGLAETLRTKYGRKVSTVYGALSPEVRREQARMFREGETDIIVATDAIGMGLNLPIRKLIFTASEKYNGVNTAALGPALTAQIAGRAGRYGLHEVGYVGALNKSVLKYVARTLAQGIPALSNKFAVSINRTLAHTIAKHTGDSRLSAVLAFFASNLTIESWAASRVTAEQGVLAAYLDRFKLSLDEKLRLLNAPAISRGALDGNFRHMVGCVEEKGIEALAGIEATQADGSLETMENRVKSLTLYCWMHYRYPALFPRIEAAQSHIVLLNSAISKALLHAQGRRCKECSKPMPWDHEYGICEACFSSRRSQYDNHYGDDFGHGYRYRGFR